MQWAGRLDHHGVVAAVRPDTQHARRDNESFAIDRVPADQRWPIPAISLVLLGNATAMFFFSFGAQQTFLVGWPRMLLPIGYFFFGSILIGMLTMRVASREGPSQNLLMSVSESPSGRLGAW
jgi:hypothetical protein